MIVWGITALNHGSSIAVFENQQLIMHQQFRDDHLPLEVIEQAVAFGRPSTVYWYERPLIKKARQLLAGQYARTFDRSVMPRQYLNSLGLTDVKIVYTPHHASHAAAGYYTSPFESAAVVVLDAIGEFESATIWKASCLGLKKVWARSYPNSLGLFYSAFTDLVGLAAVSDESQLEKMSQTGNPLKYRKTVDRYFQGTLELNYNFHCGVTDWPFAITGDQDRQDIAAAVQEKFQQQVLAVHQVARKLTGSTNLVYMGGCAFNSTANRSVEPLWDKIWSLDNPGDGTSAIGSVLYHTQQRLLINNNYNPAAHINIKV